MNVNEARKLTEIDYGTYRLSDLKTGTIIYAKETGYGYDITEIENYLNKDNKND